ncbi:MAG TPA: V-type ATP synthase subunit F [Candidatus Omnitrophota bacterium]|nr:V-type ATP synthase subunit F [Candidatus Omnitrophota bacterium]HRZ14575.1 V-type ATP synthase subunit F [Candidatus Omnitrophota bacterium]
MNFFCIADKASSLGFKLAGVETREVGTRQEAMEALQVARATKDTGIILITEKAAALIKAEIADHIVEDPIPLIIEIPSSGSLQKRTSAGELLKQLVGIGM